jgi:cytochrome P450
MTVTDDYRALFDLDPEAIRCPYPAFAKLRAEAPVHFVEETGVYLVTRYADVMRVVRDPETFSSRMPTGPHAVIELQRIIGELAAESQEIRDLLADTRMGGRIPVLLGADPPDHPRQRMLVNRAFSPPRVKQIEGSIREICDRLIDGFIADGRVELVTQFAVPLPLTVIAGALGVPDDDLGTFKRWSDDFVVLVGNHKPPKERIADYLRSRSEFGEYFAAKIAERRADPQDDLISDVVTARIDGQALSEEEMLGMFSQFLVAGNETTTKHLTATMWLLCEHPETLAMVQDDLSLVGNLVEESLRLETPVQGLYRTANRDTEIGGVPIPEGAHVMVMYAAGNRDEAQYSAPDDFDVCRANAKTHLAFSQGPHFCLGAALARSESRIALETLLGRLHDIRLAPGNTFEMEPTYVLHGFKELHLEFTAGA